MLRREGVCHGKKRSRHSYTIAQRQSMNWFPHHTPIHTNRRDQLASGFLFKLLLFAIYAEGLHDRLPEAMPLAAFDGDKFHKNQGSKFLTRYPGWIAFSKCQKLTALRTFMFCKFSIDKPPKGQAKRVMVPKPVEWYKRCDVSWGRGFWMSYSELVDISQKVIDQYVAGVDELWK